MCGGFIDLEKAFNTVDHAILLDKHKVIPQYCIAHPYVAHNFCVISAHK